MIGVMVAWLTFCGEGDWWVVVGILAFVEKVVGGWRGGEGGEAMLAVVGKVVRMAWFVETRVVVVEEVVGVVVGGWSKIKIEKE